MATLAPGSAISSLNQNDPIQVTGAFSTAFGDLLGALGSPLMASSIPTIRGLTTAMNEMSAAAGKDKQTTTVFTSGLAGTIGGALIGAGGGFLMAGPAGIIPGAIYGGGGGGMLGTAYGVMVAPPLSLEQKKERDEQRWLRSTDNGWFMQRKRHIDNPDDIWGDSSKSSWNVVPPPPVKQTVQVSSTINLDGRQIAQVVTNHQVQDGNGPAQGSPYPDTTRGGSSFDFALMP